MRLRDMTGGPGQRLALSFPYFSSAEARELTTEIRQAAYSRMVPPSELRPPVYRLRDERSIAVSHAGQRSPLRREAKEPRRRRRDPLIYWADRDSNVTLFRRLLRVECGRNERLDGAGSRPALDAERRLVCRVRPQGAASPCAAEPPALGSRTRRRRLQEIQLPPLTSHIFRTYREQTLLRRPHRQAPP